MKTKITTALLLTAVMFFASCGNKTSESKKENSVSGQTEHTHRNSDATVYQCPMDPHIIKDEAVSCPVCEMDLEQKTYHEALMFLSDFKKENPDYKEGDEFLKDLEDHKK